MDLIKDEIYLDDIVTWKDCKNYRKRCFCTNKEGVDAFLPISELSEDRVMKVTNVVNVGDEVNVMVIDFKPKNKRLVVSIKRSYKRTRRRYNRILEVEDSLGTLGELFKEKLKTYKNNKYN